MMNQVHPFMERREFERLPILLEATVTVDSDVINCVILDVSAGGAKVQLKGTDVHLKDDQFKLIVLNVPGFGDFDGQIIWTDDEYIGINFNDNHKMSMKLVLESTTKKAS